MTPRMYFTLVLRGIGVWKIAYGFEALTTAWNLHEKFYTPPYEMPGAFVSHAFVSFVVGSILLFGAATISALLVPPLQPKHPSGDVEMANV